MGLVKIGKIKDAQGLKGHVFLLIFSKDLSIIDTLDTVYLVKKDIPLLAGSSVAGPKQIQEFRQQLGQRPCLDGFFSFNVIESKIHKDGIVCLLDSMSNRTQAEQLIGVEFYVDDEHFESEDGETIYLKEILGFTLQDQDGKSRGEITGFSSNGIQDLLVVKSLDSKEFLVPFVEDLIEEINFERKIVFMTLPEGIDEI